MMIAAVEVTKQAEKANDATFVEGVGWGDCQSFLYAFVESRMPRSLRRCLGVSDLVQSVMLLIQSRSEQFNGGSSDAFRAWVFRIAENKLIDAMRRHRLQSDNLRQSYEESVQHMSSCSLASADPSHEAELRESIHELLLAIDSLSEEYQKIVAMRYISELTFEEIAAKLEIPVTTCRRRWLQALEQLSVRLRQTFS